MTPAKIVIDRFGGVHKLARLMGLSPSSVCKWGRPNGSNGSVPARHHRKLLDLAREHGKWLTLEELCFGSPEV